MKLMKNKIIILIILALTGTFILFSCKSPMDIDSPNDFEPIANRIIPGQTDIIFDENGEQISLVVRSTSVQIDTSNHIPYVWIDFVFEANQNFTNYQDSLCISQFSIKLDSLPIIPFIDDTLGSPSEGSWSCFIISSGASADTLFSGEDRNLTRVSFTFDKGRKEMKAFIYASLIKKQPSVTSDFRATFTFLY